jgi:circadian clock protein KaiB
LPERGAAWLRRVGERATLKVVNANSHGGGRVSLRLYVASDTPPSAQARRQLIALREALGGAHWDVEVVDVFEHPVLAEADRILATPTLIRLLPPPRLSVIGDFSDARAVAAALDLQDGEA